MKSEEEWSEVFRNFLTEAQESDPAHELGHVERVVRNARQLTRVEGADWSVVFPAAWLHDCVFVAKDSPLRKEASRLSADQAVSFLRDRGYPLAEWEALHHAIAAHSFSANITPRTLEARVLQDADRIDALGAVGLSRCLMLGGHMGTALMSPVDPFCENREPDDARYTIDHFYRKLLKLENTMQTAAGRDLARERSDVLRSFLAQLRKEVI
ncbi:HD domain-containing protein [Roseibacillus persicicus]|uniref:HD domain-containing protein n=1 Tax=Roseibacillus persicicus TaxID=454148 RepID=UPI00280D8238|nr:HD domain-containing protein [Roseibacillus persicicus]MDQ8192533.1 HD domain-containing protein [Roseibacillus persicicus]